MAYAYMLGLSGSLPQSGGYDRQHVVWYLERYDVVFLGVVKLQAFQMSRSGEREFAYGCMK